MLWMTHNSCPQDDIIPGSHFHQQCCHHDHDNNADCGYHDNYNDRKTTSCFFALLWQIDLHNAYNSIPTSMTDDCTYCSLSIHRCREAKVSGRKVYLWSTLVSLSRSLSLPWRSTLWIATKPSPHIPQTHCQMSKPNHHITRLIMCATF